MGYRMGCHVIRSTPEAMAFSRVSPIVKAIDNVDVLRASPDASLKVHRHYFATQDLTTPRDAANAIIASLQGYRHPLLYTEVYNEIGKSDRDKHIWFLLTAVPLLHMAGLKVAGPSWATGSFDQPDWDAFRAVKWIGMDAIACHCYFGLAGNTIWESLRYRQFWKPGDPPIILTEVGLDDV